MKSSKTSMTLGLAALAIFTAPLTVAADTGWYFGGSGGPSQTDVDEDRIAADLLEQGYATTFMDDNERDTGFKGFGGYQFNKYWAMESGYYDLGDFGYTSYTVPPGELPLDDTFHDTRFALAGSWSQPLARLYTVSAGVGFSNEFDYQHVGANAGVTRDFNQRNTTVNFAVANGNDTIKPVGGIRAPFSAMGDVNGEDESPANRIDGSDSKTVTDLLLGVSQVLGRHSVLRLNYSYSDSSGYLTDPYKLLTVVNPLSGEPVVRTPAPGATGASGVYLFESRPDSRRRQGLYAELRQDFSGKVLQLGYRYSTDDWEVDSNTLEARLRVPFGESSYLEPHLRYYQQSAASFYRYSLADGAPLPEFASADARLADLDAYTLGIKYGHETSGGNEWSTRLEFYRQSGKAPDSVLIGNQRGTAQMPDFDAVILQFNYHFKL